jgi:hypothetical protein
VPLHERFRVRRDVEVLIETWIGLADLRVSALDE